MSYNFLFQPLGNKLVPIYIVFLYILLAMGLHFAASFVKTSLIITDEVQYRLLTENLYRYGEFVLRDNFVTTIPPLYSLLLFICKKLFSLNSMQFYQLINAALFSLSLFPIYLIAKKFDLSSKYSLMIGVLGCVIPHSFYVSLCMSENLYYPLLLFFVYFSVVFVGNPSFYRSIFVGIVGGLAILTKMSACIIVLSFIVANYIVGFYYFFGSKSISPVKCVYNYWILPLVSLTVSVLIYTPWLMLKYKYIESAKSSAIGVYYSNLSLMFSKIFTIFALKMVFVYFADILFASGFVMLVPVFYGFSKLDNDSDKRKFFLIFIIVIALVLTAALFSGLNSSWLRERHVFYVIPLIVILFFKSMVLYPDNFQTRSIVVAWTLTICTTALIFLGLYNFNIASPVLETPWVEILKFYSLFGVRWRDAYSNINLFLLPLIVILSSLFFLKKTYIVKFIYLWLIIFFLTTSTATYSMVSKWSHMRLNNKANQIVKWLEGNIGQGKKVLILGHQAYFEPPINNNSMDQKLISWSDHFLLSDISTYRLELGGLYDIKIISNITELKEFSKNGNYYFLTPVIVEGLDKVSEYGPLNLYTTSNLLPGKEIFVKYQTTIDPRWFSSSSGQYLKDEDGFYIKSTGYGYVVYGPNWSLPRGTYEAEFMLSCPVDSKIQVDIYSPELKKISESIFNCYGDCSKSLQFVVTSNEVYEFRVNLQHGQVVFKGLNLKER